MRKDCRLIKYEGMSGIICGGESNHKCDDKLFIYIFSDGFRGSVFDKAKKEKLNLSMCDDDKVHFLHEKGIDIVGGSVVCSICYRAAIDNAWYM